MSDFEPAITCGMPCNCNCLDISVVAASMGGWTMCDAPDDECDGLDVDKHIPRPFVGMNRIPLEGPISSEGRCNCKFSLGSAGTTRGYGLCDGGDIINFTPFTKVEVTIYDSAYFKLEVEIDGVTLIGAGAVGPTCEVVCYNRVIPIDPFAPYTYEPRTGEMVSPPESTVLMGAIAIPNMTITLAINSDAGTCKGGCEVSQRRENSGSFPPVKISGSRGRCPTVSEKGPSAALLKSDGWQCKETDEYQDCDDNTEPPRFEFIIHKHFIPYDDPIGLPCGVECPDMVAKTQHGIEPGGGCRPFDDPAAWWGPPTADGWTTDVRAVCIQAARTGYDVYRMKLECVYWYIASATDPNLALPRLTLAAPCGAQAKFYAVHRCYDPAVTYSREITDLSAYQGRAPDGVGVPDNVWGTNTDYLEGDRVQPGDLVFMATNDGRSGSFEPTWPPGPDITVEDGAITWIGIYLECIDVRYNASSQTVEEGYALCNNVTVTESPCATCADPRAPALRIDPYTCVDCMDCYEENYDGAPPVIFKPGYVAGRYYSEVVYGADRASAVNAALARITEIQASEGTTIPYAHTLVAAGGTAGNSGNNWMDGGINGNSPGTGRGCCAGAWAMGDVSPKWADTAHVQPCDYGIKVSSTIPVAGNPYRWQSELILCCQCLESSILCTQQYSGVEGNYTDFYGGAASYRKLSVGQLDGLGVTQYCRDFDTQAALPTAWKGWSASEFTLACWAWLMLGSPVTISPWKYVYDSAADTVGASLSYNCYYAVSNHGLMHYASRYEGGASPATGYLEVCKQSAADGLYYWTGVYRECRWCDPMCEHYPDPMPEPPPSTGCSSNPCIDAWTTQAFISSSNGCCYGAGCSSPTPDFCTEPFEAVCAAYAGNRHNHSALWFSTSPHWPHVNWCDTSLLPDDSSVTGAVTCGVHFCATKCNFVLAPSYDVNPFEMYYYCYCSGSGSVRVTGRHPVAQDFFDAYAAAVEACKLNGIRYIYLGYTACEDDAGDCCEDSGLSLTAGDYTVNTYWTPSSMPGPGVWNSRLVPNTPWTNTSKRPLTQFVCSMYGYLPPPAPAISWSISGSIGDYVCCEKDSWPEESKTPCTP